MSDDGEAHPKRLKPVRLSFRQRVLCGLAGSAMVGLAAWAEVIGRDGAGVVAFVTAGTLAIMLAVVGLFPTRLIGKDYSLEFDERVEEEVKSVVAEIVDQLPAGTREQIAALEDPREALDDRTATDAMAKPRLSISEVAGRSLAFEKYVTTVLESEFRALGTKFERAQEPPDLGRAVDASYSLGSRRVALSIRAKRPDDVEQVLAFPNANPAIDDIVLVTEQDVSLYRDKTLVFSKDGYPTMGVLVELAKLLVPTPDKLAPTH